MSLYNKILVTIDCSTVDEAIVSHIIELAEIHSAKVVLLHVVHSHTRDENRALLEKAEHHLKIHVERMKARGIQATVSIKSGEPFPAIIKEIDEGKYDLVAMAVHGHGVFGDLLFGSVSDKLKHTINVPMLLIKTEN
jgi:nucleotide-binding universal stress UspA family protein